MDVLESASALIFLYFMRLRGKDLAARPQQTNDAAASSDEFSLPFTVQVLEESSIVPQGEGSQGLLLYICKRSTLLLRPRVTKAGYCTSCRMTLLP